MQMALLHLRWRTRRQGRVILVLHRLLLARGRMERVVWSRCRCVRRVVRPCRPARVLLLSTQCVGPVMLSSHRQQWRQVERLQAAVSDHSGAAHVLGKRGFAEESRRRACGALEAERELRRITSGGDPEVLSFQRAAMPPPPVRPAVGDKPLEAVPEVESVVHGLSHEVLEYIGSKTPQLQFDEVAKIRSARVLFSIMTRAQVLRVVGVLSAAEGASLSESGLESTFVITAAEEWSAARMDAFVNTWRSVRRFAESIGHRLVGAQQFSGMFTQRYLRYRDAHARASFRRRYAGRDVPAGLAQGSTARGGAGSLLRTMGSKLGFPIDVSSLTARAASKRGKRRAEHHEPHTARALLKLCRMARMGPTAAVRLKAAGFYAMGVLMPFGISRRLGIRLALGQREARGACMRVAALSGGWS